jgi:acyl-CoA thioester hydrolase
VSWAYVHSDHVRFGDLDAMGHVNNVDFLRFFESARIAFHRRILEGANWIGGERPDGFGIVVAELHANYRSPAYFDEELQTAVRPVDIGRSAYRIEFETRAGERVIGDGHAVLVGYDYTKRESVPLPDDVRARLEEAATGPDRAGGGAWA